MGWGSGNLGGGSGVLNFKIVGGTSEPSNPKENMIWVITDTPIASYIFSRAEPLQPVEGMVWIRIGTSSPVAFNALKKNGIEVYPVSEKQYVGGEWIDVEAKSYQNGEWVEWVDWYRCLLAKGMFNPDLGEITLYPENSNVKFTLETTENGAKFIKTGDNYAVAYSENTFDFTDINTMSIDTGNVSGSFIVGLSTIKGAFAGWWSSNSPAMTYVDGNTTTNIDLSNVTGKFYLAFAAINSGEYNISEIEVA